MALMTKIEEFLSIPMEKIHDQRGFHPVDLCRKVVRCLERGKRRGIRQTYAPNRFTVRLHPSDYKELRPFVGMIRSEIKGELHRVVQECNYLLAGGLDVALVSDHSVGSGKPQVTGTMAGADHLANEKAAPEDMATLLFEDCAPAAAATVLQANPASGAASRADQDHLKPLALPWRLTNTLARYRSRSVWTTPLSGTASGCTSVRVTPSGDQSGIVIECRGSKTVAKLNGLPLHQVALGDGDEIQIGDLVLVCKVDRR